MGGRRRAGAVVATVVALVTFPAVARAAGALDDLYDQSVGLQRQANDAMDAIKTGDDVAAAAPTVGPKLEAIAGQVEALAARVGRMPQLDAQDVSAAVDRHRAAERAERDRWHLALVRVKGRVALDSPLLAGIIKLPNAADDFRDAVVRSAYPKVPAPPPPVTGPPGRWTAPAVSQALQKYPADQRVTVRVRGLTDYDRQSAAINADLFQRLAAAASQGNNENDDPGAFDLTLAPVPDLAAAAERVTFGRVTVDAATRTLTVQADVARVDAVVRAQHPGAAVAASPVPSKSVPADFPVGAQVRILYGNAWQAATVVAREGRRVRIHYDGKADDYDEWVARDRLRPAAGK